MEVTSQNFEFVCFTFQQRMDTCNVKERKDEKKGENHNNEKEIKLLLLTYIHTEFLIK